MQYQRDPSGDYAEGTEFCDECGEPGECSCADSETCGTCGEYFPCSCVAEQEFMRVMGDDDGRDATFADPGGASALRAAGPDNPRNLPCPDCGARNRLTPADRARGYCCDDCARRNEGGGW